jgi:hypothetical protein
VNRSIGVLYQYIDLAINEQIRGVTLRALAKKVFAPTNLDESATSHERFECGFGDLSEQRIGGRQFKKPQSLIFTAHFVSLSAHFIIGGLALKRLNFASPALVSLPNPDYAVCPEKARITSGGGIHPDNCR